MATIRIVRTLVYEGEESWLHETLSRAAIKPDTIFHTGRGTIREQMRFEVPIVTDDQGNVL